MEKYKNLSIKTWALDDRPREKLIKKGINVLSDAELLAILIGSGNHDETAVDVAKRILAMGNNNLNELGKKNLADFMKLKGIGPAKAVTIVSALELGRRRNVSEFVPKKIITSSKSVYEYFHSILGDLPHEEFWILLLNRANKVIEKRRISQGGISATIIDTRMIMKMALDELASSIILCHNHPSGNLTPSDADIEITTKLKNAGDILDVKVLDHIIVSDSSYYSFADEGLL
ncbi:MAG: RadC family protein [Bacteroidota bacterium]